MLFGYVIFYDYELFSVPLLDFRSFGSRLIVGYKRGCKFQSLSLGSKHVNTRTAAPILIFQVRVKIGMIICDKI